MYITVHNRTCTLKKLLIFFYVAFWWIQESKTSTLKHDFYEFLGSSYMKANILTDSKYIAIFIDI